MHQQDSLQFTCNLLKVFNLLGKKTRTTFFRARFF